MLCSSCAPLVSVLVNNYNYARFLPEALDSALGQNYPRMEVVVVDDGSTDDSRTVIERYAGRDARVAPIFKQNGGQASAYNAGVAASKGEILCFLDSDDTWLPGKVTAAVEAHREHAFVQHPVMKNGRPNFTEAQCYDRHYLLHKYGFHHALSPSSALSMRRDLANLMFPIPERDLKLCADIFVRLVSVFLKGVYTIPEVFTLYRIHDRNNWYSADNDRQIKHDNFMRIMDIANKWLSANHHGNIPLHDETMAILMHRELWGCDRIKRYFIYGSGGAAVRLLGMCDKLDVKFDACIDSAPDQWGKTFRGLEIISPESAAARLGQDDRILIGSMYDNEIRDSLHAVGVGDSHILSPLQRPLRLNGKPRHF